MPPTGDAETFESTEAYYAEYRPGYGEAAIRYLVDRFDVDDSARVLDLGCGAGQITIPIAEFAGEVIGMDPNPTMLAHARKQASDAGRKTIEFVEGSDADLDTDLGSFRLVTMGRSFHWMDQEGTLERLHDLLEPGGGIAIVNGEEWLVRGEMDWQAAVYEVATEYIDDLPQRETGEVEYEDPWDALLETKGFESVETKTFDIGHDWAVDEILGYVFSLSYCSPQTFGDEMDDFEADVRERLGELGHEPFPQQEEVEVIAGREPVG